MTYLKTLLLIAIGLYLLGGMLTYFFQEKLIFQDEELPEGHKYKFNISFEEHNLKAADGAVLNTLVFKADAPKGTLLYFHGNAGNLEKWATIVRPFVDLGYNVILPDYRGYGKSTGNRSKKAMLEDAAMLYSYALSLTKEQDLIVYGRSLGSAFAAHIGGRFHPRIILLETPFHSIEDVARQRINIYPMKPLLRFDFDNELSLRLANSPIRIFHGTDDRIVPLTSAQRLERSLTGKDVKMYVYKNAKHNNLADFEKYWDNVKEALSMEHK